MLSKGEALFTSTEVVEKVPIRADVETELSANPDVGLAGNVRYQGNFVEARDSALLFPFDARYRSDATGAPASLPKTLLQVVLFASSRGVVSSRAIARACEPPCSRCATVRA